MNNPTEPGQSSDLSIRKYESEATLRMRDMLSVQADLQETQAYLQEILSHSNGTTREALWKAALVTFFKCFATGVRQYALDRDGLYASMPGEPLDFFAFMKDLRDKHVAHSVSSLEEMLVGPVIDEAAQAIRGVGHLRITRVAEPNDQVRSLLSMVEVALSQVQADVTVAQESVEAEIGGYDYETVVRWPALQYVVPNPAEAAKKARPQVPRKT